MLSFNSIINTFKNLTQDANPLISSLSIKPSSSYQASTTTQTPLQLIENRKPVAPRQAVPEFESNTGFKTVVGPGSHTPTHRFEANDLYGASGQPQDSDIDQDLLGTCYLLASLGSLADQQPEKVKKMIQYDPQSGNFTVKLHQSDGKKVQERKLIVTQTDLLDNLSRQGGSKVDNNPGTDSPIWPAVIETAYAKLKDDNHTDGLQQGYSAGAYPRDAMLSIIGKKGEDYKVANSQQKTLDKAHKTIAKALHDGKMVTLWARQETNGSLQDGLKDNHVYVVKNIYRDSIGQIMVTVRNPWGNNIQADEGTNTPNAELNMPLSVLVNSGGLEAFTIGKPPKH